VQFVDDGLAVSVRRALLLGSLRLGPLGGLVIHVLGEANRVTSAAQCSRKGCLGRLVVLEAHQIVVVVVFSFASAMLRDTDRSRLFVTQPSARFRNSMVAFDTSLDPFSIRSHQNVPAALLLRYSKQGRSKGAGRSHEKGEQEGLHRAHHHGAHCSC